MADSFEISIILPAEPARIYRAWLDSAEHSAFTGSPAEIDPQVGGKFNAWDRYIQGTNLELEPPGGSFRPGAPLSSRSKVRIHAWKSGWRPWKKARALRCLIASSRKGRGKDTGKAGRSIISNH